MTKFVPIYRWLVILVIWCVCASAVLITYVSGEVVSQAYQVFTGWNKYKILWAKILYLESCLQACIKYSNELPSGWVLLF